EPGRGARSRSKLLVAPRPCFQSSPGCLGEVVRQRPIDPRRGTQRCRSARRQGRDYRDRQQDRGRDAQLSEGGRRGRFLMASVWISKRPTSAGATRYRVIDRVGGRESTPRDAGTFKTKREA